MGYRIGSFNVKKLSYATKDEDLNDNVSAKREYDVIGSIIKENFSIVALQEVLNENVIKMLGLPSHWKYEWSRSYSKISDSEEGYAFAWDTRRIQSISDPHIWGQYSKDPSLGRYGLLRQPFYARFKAIGPNCEFRLINTHIRFSPKKANEDLVDIKAFEARRREFDILSKQILNKIEDKRYGNYMPAYTMLLGDYNLNLNTSSVTKNCLKEDFFVIQDGNCNKKIVTVQDKLTTLKYKKIDQGTGQNCYEFDGYASNYDHFTYNETYFNESGLEVKTDIIDTVSRYSNNDFERHYRKISDHIPIMMEINLK